MDTETFANLGKPNEEAGLKSHPLLSVFLTRIIAKRETLVCLQSHKHITFCYLQMLM